MSVCSAITLCANNQITMDELEVAGEIVPDQKQAEWRQRQKL